MKMDEGSLGNETADRGDGAGWIALTKGDNKIRIVSGIYMAFKHRMQIDGKWKQIVCPNAMNDEKDCPICKQAGEWDLDNPESNQPNPFRYSKAFMVAVIDRKDGVLKILEKGKGVFGQLQGLINSTDYCPNGKISDLMEFDINIKRDGDGLATKYQILPLPRPKALTKEEQDMIAKDMPDFEQLTMPKTAEQIRKMLGTSDDSQATPEAITEALGDGN